MIPFLLARKGYGSKDSREMGNFQSTCPKASIKVILEYHDFGTCIFWSLKGFGKFEAIASFDAYQITICQTLQKLIINFFLLDFRRIREKKFLN